MHCMVEGAQSCVGLSGGNTPPQLRIHASSDGPETISVCALVPHAQTASDHLQAPCMGSYTFVLLWHRC